MKNDVMTLPPIHIKKALSSKIHEVDFNNLVFGRKFSDHMLTIEFANGEWGDINIKPFQNISISPAMNGLHYGQSIFEGMKAFYVDEKTINIFRPDLHHQRLNNSARRMSMPELSFEHFISGLEALVKTDADWIPKNPGTALYIRPFMFASDDLLAARVSEKYSFYVFTSPVGAYYKEGFSPVKLKTPEGYVRAVKGGTGEAKTAGNYAASFLPAKKAQDLGFTQVLWLDAIEKKYVEEVGTMNIHFLIGDTLVTPQLGGTVLPGVTRRSVVTLAEEWGLNVEERRISIDEVFEASANGSLKEVFGSGTAAVISPVGLIEHNGEQIHIGNGVTAGELAQKLYNEITDIQYGHKVDSHGWIHQIKL